MYTRLHNEYGNHPKIDFICEMKESSIELYEKHHIYVSPHLSEGFGLMPIEAMATGMPCLVSRCSSPREYFDKKYGWWIEMSEEYAPVFQCLPETNSYWRLPDIKSLASVMRKSYDNKIESANRGILASSYVRENLTWDICVTKIKEIVREVLDAFGSVSETDRAVC
jgi:glycosyltransferase involved in cell wall biosynthesis